MDNYKEIVLSPKDQEYLDIVEDLNAPIGLGKDVGLKTRLHEGQISALRDIYVNKKSLVIIPSGRKFGKTELAMYVLWRQALLTPHSACYYIVPENNHGRKIVWNDQRIQRFLGTKSHKYIIQRKVRNNDMFIPFANGSFIQIIGSENFAAANGLTPSIAVYDEFKAFHPRWHVEFAPNLVAKAAPLVVIGTLPVASDRNAEQYSMLIEDAKTDPDAAIHIRTTFDNPINHLPAQKKAIEAEIRRLRARGEEDVVQREYYSKIVPGGKRSIFPMLSKDAHMRPHKDLLEELARDRTKLEWYLVADPGNVTVFAALFIALNPYTKKVYVLDEIYEKEQMNTSTQAIYPKMLMKATALYPEGSIHDDWFKIMDEQAVWFATEVMNQYQAYFQASAKHLRTKEENISLIKDMLLHECLVVSDRCEKFWWEMENYVKDDKGNIPKRNDHTIDSLRYALTAMNYNMQTIVDSIVNKATQDGLEDRRYRSLSHDNEDEVEEDPWSYIYDF